MTNIIGATITGDPPAPSCFSPDADPSFSVWYRFRPNQAGNYLITLCSDGGTQTTVGDTILAVYTSPNACNGPFTEVAGGCNDDSCGPFSLQSSVLLSLSNNTTYYILVWQYDAVEPQPESSSVQLLISRLVVPENDLCANATPVSLNHTYAGSTVGANNNYTVGDLACYTGIDQMAVPSAGPDVVYRFTAPTGGLYNFQVSHYTIFSDLILHVATDCPTGSGPSPATGCLGVANRSPLSSAETIVGVPLAENQSVYIYVDEYMGGSGSHFHLEVTACHLETEPNNTGANATVLRCGMASAIQSFGDLDYFYLGSPEPDSRVFAMLDGESARVPDFDLRVVTATDTLEYDNDNNDSTYGETSPNVAGSPLTGEAAYLRVNFSTFEQREPYFVYAVVQPGLVAAETEFEPNNQAPDAQTAPGNYYFGTLSEPAPSSDVDFYRFTALQGDLLFVAADGDPTRDGTPMNLRLDLLDEEGNYLAGVNDSSSSSVTNHAPGSVNALFPSSPGEALIAFAPVTGVYFARVSIGTGSPDSTGAGDYLLSITKNCFTGSEGTNSWPYPDLLTITTPIAQGQTASLSGFIADKDLGQRLTVSIDWGDNTPLEVLMDGRNQFALTAEHVYAEAPAGTNGSSYSVVVTVNDDRGGTGASGVPIVVYRSVPGRFLSIQRISETQLRLEMLGTPSSTYEIWVSNDLDTWSFLRSEQTGLDGLLQMEDPALPGTSQRFYQARGL